MAGQDGDDVTAADDGDVLLAHRLVGSVLVGDDDLADPQDALLGGGLVEQVPGAAGIGDAAHLVLDEDEPGPSSDARARRPPSGR